MKLLPLLALLMLTGCATLQQKWEFRDSSELLEEYGIPNNRLAYSKGEIWEYVDQCQSSGMVSPVYGSAVGLSSSRCRYQIFKISNGMVITAKTQRK